VDLTITTSQRRDRFSPWPAIAAFAVVVAGFARTYYLKLAFGSPALPWLLHLHAALMTAWLVLFFVQARLVAVHRVGVHRRLGIAGAVLAVLLVVVGASVALHAGARDRLRPNAGGPPALALMGFFLIVLFVFAVFVGTALLLRRRRDWHKRLMLLSCVVLTGPALSRLPLERIPMFGFLKSGGAAGLFSLDLLIVYGCIAYDTWRNRRAHPAFIGGALLMMIYDTPRIWVFLSSPFSMRVATWLTS
jgi:hypothetical protein